MNKIYRLLVLSGLLLFMFSSCKKDDTTSPEIPVTVSYAPNAKLKRILSYESITAKQPLSIVADYEYDASGKISKVSHPFYKDGKVMDLISYDQYEYNAKGLLDKIKNYTSNLNVGFINLKNTSYTYLADGTKQKELIEFPQIGSHEYSLFKYSGARLTKIEYYDAAGVLQTYIMNEYDDAGLLKRETLFSGDNKSISFTINSYQNRLNIKSDVYGGTDMQHVREIKKTYDINNNLVALESTELAAYSNMSSFVIKYEYY